MEHSTIFQLCHGDQFYIMGKFKNTIRLWVNNVTMYVIGQLKHYKRTENAQWKLTG